MEDKLAFSVDVAFQQAAGNALLESATMGWAILAAGGSGQRFSASLPQHTQEDPKKDEPSNKLLALLQGEAVFVHALRLLLESQSLAGVVVVAAPAYLSTYQALVQQAVLPQNKIVLWQTGGATRRASVLCGLQALQAHSLTPPWVLVHDGARPMLRPSWVDALCTKATQTPELQGLLLGYPVKDTLKQSKSPLNKEAESAAKNKKSLLFIENTASRESLWQVQTPQWFKTDALLKAHALVPQSTNVTDDAQLLELAGLGAVALMAGPCENLKLTTVQDLTMAEALWPVRSELSL
jgi:2-C-methyl-D-erythritol 4-phosphate cytidylyltransferase